MLALQSAIMIALLCNAGNQLELRLFQWPEHFRPFFGMRPEQMAAGKAVEDIMSSQHELHARLLTEYGRVTGHGAEALAQSITALLVRSCYFCSRRSCWVSMYCGGFDTATRMLVLS